MKTLAECARAYCEAKIEAAALVKTIRGCTAESHTCYKEHRFVSPDTSERLPIAEWCDNCRDSETRVMPRLRVLRRSMGGLVRAMMAAHSREAVCRAAGFEGREEG